MTTPEEPELSAKNDAGQPPRELQLSFWLWIATALMTAFAAVVYFVNIDEVGRQARELDVPGQSPDQREAAGRLLFTMLGIGGIITTALVVWGALKIRTGVSWSRILLTVVGIGIILFGMIGYTELGLPTAIAAFGGVITLYLRPVQEFFAAAKRTS